MPVRDFAAGGVIRTAVGSGDTPGALTYVALVKLVAGTEWMIARHPSAGAWSSMGRETAKLRLYPGDNSPSEPPSGVWLLCAISKTAGSSKARYSYYNFTTETWTHKESVSAFTATYGGVPAEIHLGQWNGTEQFNGRYAAAMIFGKALSQAEVEALVAVEFQTDWLALGPLALWQLGQASVEEIVEDITGNGADEVSRTGTTVAEEEPPIPYEAEPTISPPRPGSLNLLGAGR